MPTGLISSVTKELGSSGAVTAGMAAVTACAACTTPTAVLATLAGGAAVATPFLSVLVLGSVLEWARGNRNAKAAKADLQELHRALGRIEAAQQSDADWAALVSEVFADRIGAAEEFPGGPEAMIAAAHEALRAEGQDMREHFDAWLDGVRIYLSNISADVREARENTLKLVRGQGEMFDAIQRMIAEFRRFSAVRDVGPAIAIEDQTLMAAIERLARDAARGGMTAQRVLSSERPELVVEYLGAVIRSLDAGAAALAGIGERVAAEREDALRELAEVAYVTGQIDCAASAAHRIVQERPDDPGAITRLGHIAMARGEFDEAVRLHQRVFDTATQDFYRAVALGNIGRIELERGNLDAASDCVWRSMKIGESLGRMDVVAHQLGNLGLIEKTRSNLEAAKEYHRRSLAIYETLKLQHGMASQLGNLGLISRRMGDLNAAEEFHRRSLEIEETLGHREGMANQLGNLGAVEQTRGNLDAAEAYHKRSLAINEQIGRMNGVANALGNLGVMELARDNLDAAEAYIRRSLAICEQTGRRRVVANQLGNLGLVEKARKNFENAEQCHRRSLAIHEEMGRQEGIASELGNLGLVEQARGNLITAESYLNSSLVISQKWGLFELSASQLENLGELAQLRGDDASAREHWTRARDLFDKIGMRRNSARVRTRLGQFPER